MLWTCLEIHADQICERQSMESISTSSDSTNALFRSGALMPLTINHFISPSPPPPQEFIMLAVQPNMAGVSLGNYLDLFLTHSIHNEVVKMESLILLYMAHGGLDDK